MIKFPKPFKKGDKVFLICPSSPILAEDDIEKCNKAITALGLTPVYGKSLYENYGGYMAGKVDVRINDLHEAFRNPEIKGVFCVKGGYSASQLLGRINYDIIRSNPKIFIGYSDVTNLHIAFNQKCNLGTYHGPMVKSNMFNDFNEYTQNSLFTALNLDKWEYKEPEGMPVTLLNNRYISSSLSNGSVSGILTGGNLAIIVTTLGTEHEIDTDGKILFLEDVDEEIGSIDRMLTHLKYTGKLDKCNGIIFGNFAACKNTYSPENNIYKINELLQDFFEGYDKPVILGIESGHKKPFMATLPLGAMCRIEIPAMKIKFIK